MTRSYPSYKPTHLEWVNQIPEHWSSVNLRWVTQIFAGGTPSKEKMEYWENGTIPWISSGEVNQGYITSPTTYITEEAFQNSSAKWIRKDSLVMALAGQGKTKATVAQLGIDTTCNQSLAAIVPLKIHARYLFFWLQSNYRRIRGLVGDGLRDGLNLEILGSLPALLPPLSEQQAIADFLDCKTAQIDTLIEKKQRQIDLLQEQRTALINHAVTKGLNPNASMKDSGVEWLGEIPKHWEVSKLRYLANKIGSGITPRGGAETYQESGIPFIRSQNVHFDGLRLDDIAYISKEVHETMSNSAVRPNDVLLNITGASIGRCAVVPEGFWEANVNQHVCIIRVKGKINPQFLNLLLSSNIGQNQVWLGQGGAAREGLNYSNLSNFFILLPPLDEQEEIVEQIHNQLVRINLAQKQFRELIRRYQEYRTALISEAVTGKINVIARE